MTKSVHRQVQSNHWSVKSTRIIVGRRWICFHGWVIPVLQVVVDLAGGGRLGEVACGLSLTRIEALIGPFHERRTDLNPRSWRPRLHFWDDLEVLVCHEMAIGMTLPTWRDTVTLPPATRWPGPLPVRLSRGEVLPALTDAGIDWTPASRPTQNGRGNAVHVPDTRTSLLFDTDPEPDRQRLHSVTVFRPEVDQNDHRPDQPQQPDQPEVPDDGQ
jgi:hypothetical protein